MPIPATAPLLPRQELFAHHVAYGASLAQAARLAGYSPQGARQRGSLLMANSDIRIRVETLRRSWLADREKHIGEAVAEVAQVIDKALRLDRPAAAIKAIELKLKLQGVIRDPRFSLYTVTPDDDLTTCLFDPREDEDMPIDLPPDPEPQPQPDSEPEEAGSPAEIPTTPVLGLPARPATVPAARDCPGRRVMTNHDIPGLSAMFSTPVLQPVLASCR
jgi:hypothetical protein